MKDWIIELMGGLSWEVMMCVALPEWILTWTMWALTVYAIITYFDHVEEWHTIIQVRRSVRKYRVAVMKFLHRYSTRWRIEKASTYSRHTGKPSQSNRRWSVRRNRRGKQRVMARLIKICQDCIRTKTKIRQDHSSSNKLC